jgi:hypothetical protein
VRLSSEVAYGLKQAPRPYDHSPLHSASTLCHSEGVGQHQSRCLFPDNGGERHNLVLLGLLLFLVLKFLPGEGLHQDLLAVLARLHVLECFLGYENVRIIVIVPILNAERHLRNDNRVLGLHAFHPRYHDLIPEVVGAGLAT